MNRIRIGLAITIIIGAIYAAAGLFDSLTQFGIGAAVASAGMVGYGLLDFIEAREAEEMNRYRAEVWARRHAEVTAESELRPGIYVRGRDEVA